MSVYSFSHYPEQIVTTYGLDGQIQGEPRRYLNITEADLGNRFPLIDSANKAGNFAPFSKTWTFRLNTRFRRYCACERTTLIAIRVASCFFLRASFKASFQEVMRWF